MENVIKGKDLMAMANKLWTNGVDQGLNYVAPNWGPLKSFCIQQVMQLMKTCTGASPKECALHCQL